jgi:acetyl-CoA carboxylase biotin carboxyl carrier protein
VTDGSARLELDERTIHALLEAFDESDWLEMTISAGNDRLYVSRRPHGDGAPRPARVEPSPVPASPAPASEPAVPAPSAPAPETLAGAVVESPSVGLFWRSPAPGAPPFVEAGQQVSAGDTLAIVEVMKLMNHVVAPAPGIVEAILAENGARVEYGQPLLTIVPEG